MEQQYQEGTELEEGTTVDIVIAKSPSTGTGGETGGETGGGDSGEGGESGGDNGSGEASGGDARASA